MCIRDRFVSESLTPIKPIPYPEGPPPDFVWGQLSAEKSRILSFHNYPQNTDVEIEYVFENPPSYGYKEEDEFLIKVSSLFV